MLYYGPVRPSSERSAVAMDAVSGLISLACDSMDNGRPEEALFDLDSALALMPNSVHAHCNRSQALLALGQYSEGFRELEWFARLRGDRFGTCGVPLWRGEDLYKKRLLLHHDHGYGDTIMMLRYVPVLKERGAIITLLMPTALVRIAREFNVYVRDVPPEDYSQFDYRCPMMSIMVGLEHEIKDIPSSSYIDAGWQFLDGHSRRIPNAIGIAWSGNRTHLRDNHRSIDLDLFLSLLCRNWWIPVSVQKDEQDKAAKANVITTNLKDFFDTTNVMACVNHIVTVDTAAAHLAGAIGHPSVHVLLPYAPDWRWYNAQAWYPKVNVHRQKSPGDWASAFASVNKRLA